MYWLFELVLRLIICITTPEIALRLPIQRLVFLLHKIKQCKQPNLSSFCSIWSAQAAQCTGQYPGDSVSSLAHVLLSTYCLLTRVFVYSSVLGSLESCLCYRVLNHQ